MFSQKELERAISEQLPNLSYASVLAVAEFLAKVLTDKNTLQQFTGQELEVGKSVVSFGAGSQIGDITIRDIAGGNIVHLNITNLVQQNTDRTAAELAIRRLSDELYQLQKNRNNIISKLEELSTREEQRFTIEHTGCGCLFLVIVTFLIVWQFEGIFWNLKIIDFLFWPSIALCVLIEISQIISFIVRSYQLNIRQKQLNITQEHWRSKYQLEIEDIDKEIAIIFERLNRNKAIVNS